MWAPLQVLLAWRPAQRQQQQQQEGGELMEGGGPLLGDVIVHGDAGPTRFVDLHNGENMALVHCTARLLPVPLAVLGPVAGMGGVEGPILTGSAERDGMASWQ